MTASVWGMVKVSKATHSGLSYTLQWWMWLFFTGAMLSCTISVKFVGLFVVLLVGFYTANELWLILGDLTKPVVSSRLLKPLKNSIKKKLFSYGFVIFFSDGDCETTYLSGDDSYNMAFTFVYGILLHSFENLKP